MRINARFDPAAEKQIEYLAQSTGHNVSHVVREAVAHYYTHVRAQQGRPSRFLALAGSGDSGRSDVASNVKAHLVDILGRKFKPVSALKAALKAAVKTAATSKRKPSR